MLGLRGGLLPRRHGRDHDRITEPDDGAKRPPIHDIDGGAYTGEHPPNIDTDGGDGMR